MSFSLAVVIPNMAAIKGQSLCLPGRANQVDVSAGPGTVYLPNTYATDEREPQEIIVTKSDSSNNLVSIAVPNYRAIIGATSVAGGLSMSREGGQPTILTLGRQFDTYRFVQFRDGSWWPAASPPYATGTGAPTIAGNVGDYYFRRDTPGTVTQRIYVCTVAGAAGAATWVATAA